MNTKALGVLSACPPATQVPRERILLPNATPLNANGAEAYRGGQLAQVAQTKKPSSSTWNSQADYDDWVRIAADAQAPSALHFFHRRC